MFGNAILEFAVILLVGSGLVFLLASRRSDSGAAPPPPDVAPDMTLNCPSCGKETDAARSACRHCDSEL